MPWLAECLAQQLRGCRGQVVLDVVPAMLVLPAKGARVITYNTLEFPYYTYSIMGPKTLF